MPNCFQNKLTVTGPRAALSIFVYRAGCWVEDEGAHEDERTFFVPMNFDEFVPEPETEEDAFAALDEHHAIMANMTGGVLAHWRYQYHGTKGLYGDVTRFYSDGTSAVYRFDTANGFPEPVIRAMAAQHPALTFRWRGYDGGYDTGGFMLLRGGVVVEERSYDSKDDQALERFRRSQRFANCF